MKQYFLLINVLGRKSIRNESKKNGRIKRGREKNEMGIKKIKV